MTMRAMEGLFARMLANVAKKEDIAAVTVKVEKNTERIVNIEECTRDLRHELDSLKNEVRSGVHSASFAAAGVHGVTAPMLLTSGTGVRWEPRLINCRGWAPFGCPES